MATTLADPLTQISRDHVGYRAVKLVLCTNTRMNQYLSQMYETGSEAHYHVIYLGVYTYKSIKLTFPKYSTLRVITSTYYHRAEFRFWNLGETCTDHSHPHSHFHIYSHPFTSHLSLVEKYTSNSSMVWYAMLCYAILYCTALPQTHNPLSSLPPSPFTNNIFVN